MLQGTGNYKIKSAPQKPRPTKLFLTRTAPDTKDDDIKDHIRDTFSLDVNVQQLTTKYPSYASFVITTTTTDYKQLLDDSKWPTNIALRKWYEPRSKPLEKVDTPAGITDERPGEATLNKKE